MQEFLIMGFQKQFIFPCFLFISTLSHLFLSSSQVGGVFRRNRTLFFVSNELFVLPFIFYVTQSVSVVCGYKSERAGVRAPEIKKNSKNKYFLCSSPYKEQIGGGYLAPGLVLTLPNFIQENYIIFFIFSLVASGIKKA